MFLVALFTSNCLIDWENLIMLFVLRRKLSVSKLVKIGCKSVLWISYAKLYLNYLNGKIFRILNWMICLYVGKFLAVCLLVCYRICLFRLTLWKFYKHFDLVEFTKKYFKFLIQFAEIFIFPTLKIICSIVYKVKQKDNTTRFVGVLYVFFHLFQQRNKLEFGKLLSI